MKRKPTLKDVASLAQVSEMTVSRVLRNKADTTEKTREKVLKAAKKVGYVQNRIAGALSSKRVNLVGLVVPSLSNMVFSDVVMGVTKGLEGSELQPVFGVTHYDLNTEENVIREMLAWRPSGLIIAGLEHNPDTTRAMAAADIPIVEIMDTDGHPTDLNVGISQKQAGYDMGSVFIERGRRKIGYIGSMLHADVRARKRFEGFEAALNDAGVSVMAKRFVEGGSVLSKGRSMTEDILREHPELDSLYFSTDFLAVGGLMHCISNDINVPERLALAGFNGLELLEGLPKRLATTNADRYETGRIAAKLIRESLNGNFLDPVVKLSGKIVLGDTL